MSTPSPLETSAAALLTSRGNAFKTVFSPLPVHDTLFFDEGPRIPNRRPRDFEAALEVWQRQVDAYENAVETAASELTLFADGAAGIVNNLYTYLTPNLNDSAFNTQTASESGSLTPKTIFPTEISDGISTGAPAELPSVFHVTNGDGVWPDLINGLVVQLDQQRAWPSGSSGRIYPSETGFDMGTDMTVSTWFAITQIVNKNMTIVASSGSTGTGWAVSAIQQPSGTYNLCFSASVAGTQVSSIIAPITYTPADNIEVSGAFPTGNHGWHHVVLRKTGALIELFYDGAVVGSTTYGGTITGTPGLSYGAMYDGRSPLIATGVAGTRRGFIIDVGFWTTPIPDVSIDWLQSYPIYRAFEEPPVADEITLPPDRPLDGAMDTTPVDPYVQGVEMTRQVQYDAGMAKIWSGEAGHRLLVNHYGQNKNFFPNPGFADLDLFDPQRFIEVQDLGGSLFSRVFTFPIVTGDNNQQENFYFNGVIEPLSVRPVASFFSTEAPFEARTVRGTVMGGNVNQLHGSDQVLTVDYFEPDREIVGYLDMVDMLEGHPTTGYFQHEFTPILPFDDQRLVRNVPSIESETSDMTAALSLMSGSTDNYVKHNQRSATCGWYYDNNTGLGTDSLVFGGMTY